MAIQRITTEYTERSAREQVSKLVDKGIRAWNERRSRTIEEEPYVEHTHVVFVDYLYIDEVNCAKRILQIVN